VTKLVALGIVLAACGTDGGMTVDRHALGVCDSVWTANGFTACETGCMDSSVALLATGPSCQAKTATSSPVSCAKTFVFDGVTGCCASELPNLYFADCQP
jgi:hypothetical protein